MSQEPNSETASVSLSSLPSAARAQILLVQLQDAFSLINHPYSSVKTPEASMELGSRFSVLARLFADKNSWPSQEFVETPEASMELGSRFSVLDGLFADKNSWPSQEEVLDIVAAIIKDRRPEISDQNDAAALMISTLTDQPYRDISLDTPFLNSSSAVLEHLDRAPLKGGSLTENKELKSRLKEMGESIGLDVHLHLPVFRRVPVFERSERRAKDVFLSRMVREVGLDLSSGRGRNLMFSALAGSNAWEPMPDVAESLLANTPSDQRAVLLSSPTDRSFESDTRDRCSLFGCLVMCGNPWGFKLLDKYIPEWTSLVDSKGRSPLFYGRSGYAIRYMTARGCDPTIKNHSEGDAVGFFREKYPSNKVWNDAVVSGLDTNSLLTASIVLKITTLSVDTFNSDELAFLTDLAVNPKNKDWTWAGSIGSLNGHWSIADIWRLTLGAVRHSYMKSFDAQKSTLVSFSKDFRDNSISVFGASAASNLPNYAQCGDFPEVLSSFINDRLNNLPVVVRNLLFSPGDLLVAARPGLDSLTAALVGSANTAMPSFKQYEKKLIAYDSYSGQASQATLEIHSARANQEASVFQTTLGHLMPEVHRSWVNLALNIIPKIQDFRSEDCWTSSLLATAINLLQATARPVHIQNGLATEEIGRQALSSRLDKGFRSSSAILIWADAFHSAIPSWKADRELPDGPEKEKRLKAWSPLVHIGISILSTGQSFSGASVSQRAVLLSKVVIPMPPSWDNDSLQASQKITKGTFLTPAIVFSELSETLIDMLDSGVHMDKVPVRVLKKLERRFKAACERSMLQSIVGCPAEEKVTKVEVVAAPVRRKM